MKAVSLFLVVTVVACHGGQPVDPEATKETKQLYDSLYATARNPNHFLWGHHQATEMGASGGHSPYSIYEHDGFKAWDFTDSMVNSSYPDELSDAKLVSGYYPAFVGFEFGQLDQVHLKKERYLTQRAHARGMVVAMSWHFGNMVTGGDAWDTRGHKILQNILPGGSLNKLYNSHLDTIADYANSLLDSNGNLIPIIFRLFHESNGAWFWWGVGNQVNNTGDDVKAAHRYVVHYLRDVKNVHNLLYATSPNAGYVNLTTDGALPSYMTVYPGDEYVDILGYDDYQNVRFTKSLQQFADCLSEVVLYSESRDKIPALTETGLNIKNEIDKIPNWWTDYILNSIKGQKYVKYNPSTRRIAYVLTWANGCFSTINCSYYFPFKGHKGEMYFRNFTSDPMVGMLGKPGYA